MITKSFKEWDSEEVEKIFGVTRLWNKMPEMKDLLNVDIEIESQKNEKYKELQELLYMNVDAWNEDELKMFFIAPLLSIIKLYHFPYYKSFTQRTLTIKNEYVNCKGEVEFCLATGRKNPEKPFFFLHEYKQEEQRNNDALGQLLIAMMAAKLQNETNNLDINFPLYGCYILGRFWFFVVLKNDQYEVSKAFDTTEEDLYAVIIILKKIKNEVEKYFNL